MPEKTLKTESKQILGNILARTFDCGSEVPFEDLIEKLDNVKQGRDSALDEAEQRLVSLLNTTANTELQ